MVYPSVLETQSNWRKELTKLLLLLAVYARLWMICESFSFISWIDF